LIASYLCRSVWQARLPACLTTLIVLAACGGNGGGNGGGNPNRAPTANAGSDQTVAELSEVNLNGSGSDPDAGDMLTYLWAQTGGQTVTINNANSAQASFTAPDVVLGNPETLTFQLTVSDGTANDTDTVAVTVQEPSPIVTVSGRINYEFVPPNTNCGGLNFDGTTPRPIRGATVQLVDAGSGAILDSTVSNDTGDYAFVDVDANTLVRLRIRAELKKPGTPGWDVEVRNNVDTNASPPPLASRPLYVLEGAEFDTGNTNVNRNLTATTGWGGTSYDSPRSAAPFAILDSIYSAMQFIVATDATADFPPLDVFWSVDNTPTTPTDIDAGEIGASFYRGDIDSLFLLGDANVDTEEFDDHVIVHEWGHYFEDNFSRSDSIGGSHSVGERLDPRLAFGEGWATAFAAMALGDPLYCDTSIAGSSGGFGIGADEGSYDAQGWYDEISVLRFIYDLYDDVDEGGDAGSIGFAPIYDVMTGPQAFTEAFTTVFSFATELRSILPPADQALLDAQLGREDMTAAGLDIWGTNELNDALGAPDVMPIYTDITADGSVLNICSNSQFDNGRDGNKLTEDRYLRIQVPLTDQYDVTVTTTTATPPTEDPDDRDQSDPDIYIYRGAQLVAAGTGPDENSEPTFRTPTLTAGQTYIAYVEEWRFDDEEASPTYPERVCFDISFSPTP